VRASADATAAAAAAAAEGAASARANVVGGTSVARRSTGAFDREAMTPVGRIGGGSTLELSPASRRFLERD